MVQENSTLKSPEEELFFRHIEVNVRQKDIHLPLPGEIHAYVDGSLFPKEGIGGWACFLVSHDGQGFIRSGSHDTKSIARMELTATIHAIAMFACFFRRDRLIIKTDYDLFANAIKTRLDFWHENGWKNSRGTFIKNVDLWLALRGLFLFCDHMNLSISFEWVKSHQNDTGNTICDQAARQSVEERIKNATMPSDVGVTLSTR